MVCHHTYVWKVPFNRELHYQHWFKLWVTESCSIKLLCKLSGYSKFKLNRIKNYWLNHSPKEKSEYTGIKYVVYDATYFHKNGCLISIMNTINQNIIASIYVKKESFKDAYPWFMNLKLQGLDPCFITTDGEQSILRAMKLAWPKAKLQRCLYHLQHEGMRWLRTYPKTEAGLKLRSILSRLSSIRKTAERDLFIREYQNWVNHYKNYVLSLPQTQVAFKDLKRTMVLINNALADMFYFLEDTNIHSTTNALEGFHSRLKADYRRHRGLSQEHKLLYLKWYCYFQNTN
jgi:hypothetical protein